MPVTLGDGVVTGLTSGGLPDLALDANTVYSGAVLQVVQTVKTDVFSGGGAATTFYDITGFVANITPQLASSKILVMADMQLGTGYWEIQGVLRRNGSNIAGSLGTARGSRLPVTFAVNAYENAATGYQMYRVAFDYLDSPGNTTQQSYSVAINTYSTYGVYMNRSGNDNDAADYYGCPASSLTLMEIKA